MSSSGSVKLRYEKCLVNWGNAKRLKELEAENGRLKRLLAEAMLENEVTKEALRKKW